MSPPASVEPRAGLARRFAFGVVLAILVVAFALAVGEVGARLLGALPNRDVPLKHGWAAHEPVLGWVNRPGIAHSEEAGFAPMTFWPGGRRATRPRPEAPPGTATLLLVGCSMTQGYGVSDGETYAWLLDAALPELSVENYGTGGYGTYQSLLLLRRLLGEQKLRPDLVVYGFSNLHAARNVQTFGWLSALRTTAGERLAAPHVVLVDGELEERPLASLSLWPLERVSALVRASHDSLYRFRLRGRGAQKVAATQRLLAQMQQLVAASGSELLVVNLYDAGEPELYAPFFESQGIRAIDCSHAEDVWATPRLRVGGGGHPNAVVHRHWAACIGRWLTEEWRPGYPR